MNTVWLLRGGLALALFCVGAWVGYTGARYSAPALAQAAPLPGAVLPGGAHVLPRGVGKVGVNTPKPPKGTPGTLTGYAGVTLQPVPHVPAGLPAECAAVTCGPVEVHLWQTDTRMGPRVTVDAEGAEITGGTSLLVKVKPFRPWAVGIAAQYVDDQWQPGVVVQRTFWERVDVGATVIVPDGQFVPGVQVLWRL